MRFSSDRQRKAAFANIFSQKSYPCDSVLSTEPKYVYDGDIVNQFSLEEAKKVLENDIKWREGKRGLNPEITKRREEALARLEAADATVPDLGLDEPGMAPPMQHLDDDVYEKFAKEWNLAKTQSAKDEVVRKYNEGENQMSWNPQSLAKYEIVNKRIYNERKQGKPLDELREDFINEMSEFVIEQMPGESNFDYVKRAKEEQAFTVGELEYLSKVGNLKK